MEEIISNLLESATFGNVLNILGILLTVIGFAITIRSSFKAQNAAQAAQKEVAKVRDDLRKVNTVADFVAAIALIEQIKEMHREDKWPMLPDKYSSLKTLIISIKDTYTGFSEEQERSMQSAMIQITAIQHQVERYLRMRQAPPDVPKIIHLLTKYSDSLKAVLVYVKNDIGA